MSILLHWCGRIISLYIFKSKLVTLSLSNLDYCSATATYFLVKTDHQAQISTIICIVYFKSTFYLADCQLMGALMPGLPTLTHFALDSRNCPTKIGPFEREMLEIFARFPPVSYMLSLTQKLPHFQSQAIAPL